MGFSSRGSVGLVLAGALLVGGCSTGGEPAEQAGAGSGPLGKLSGAQLCDLVDPATIEREFAVAIAEPLGGDDKEEGVERTVSCAYPEEPGGTNEGVDDMFILNTSVSVATGAAEAQQALAEFFVDSDGKAVRYERLDGLGAAAGYAAEVGTRERVLLVVLDVDDTVFTLTLSADPTATARQLEPVAAELVPGLQSTLARR